MRIEKVISYEEIYKVLNECKNDFYNQSLNNEESIQNLAHKFSENANVVLALEEEKILGFIAYYNNNLETRSGFVSMIIVKAGTQGKGVGTQLLKVAENDCKSAGMLNIRLEVASENFLARRFYARNGYAETSDRTDSSIYLAKVL